MDFESADTFDCTSAWESGMPFVHVKSQMYKQAIECGQFHMEYPYDEFFNAIATKVLVIDAEEKEKTICVHYGWEPLGEDIVVYSIVGQVLYTDISISDKEVGFLIDSETSETMMALPYKGIFWIEEIE